MLRAIPRSRCQMDFVCKGRSTGDLAEVAERLGARVFHCALGPSHVPFARGLRTILTAGRYQILHSHLELYSGLPVWLACRLRVPVITSFHNTHFPPQEAWAQRWFLRQLRWMYGTVSIRYALRRADLVTGCSEAVLASLDPTGRKIPPQRRQVLHYGVDLPEPPAPEQRVAFRKSLRWPAGTPLVLHVGRFAEQKNHLGVLTVFRRVLRAVPEARLLLVGEGILRPAIERAIAAQELTERVRLLGPRGDIAKLMGACDVFLFPSLHEGFGLVAIEANAAALPVVGSRIPGLTEAVRDGVTAVLHDVDDLEGMAASVIRILSDRSFARHLADAGRAWVRERFTVAASAERLLETYDRFTPTDAIPWAAAD